VHIFRNAVILSPDNSVGFEQKNLGNNGVIQNIGIWNARGWGSFDTALPKTVFITFLLHVCSSVNRDMWIKQRACMCTVKKKKKIHRATLVEGLETYVRRCLRMNVKSVSKNSFPSAENIAIEKKAVFIQRRITRRR